MKPVALSTFALAAVALVMPSGHAPRTDDNAISGQHPAESCSAPKPAGGQNGPANKTFYPPATKEDTSKLCGVQVLGDWAPKESQSEQCLGSRMYCDSGSYKFLGEKFDSREDCLRSRGQDPNQEVSPEDIR